MFSEPSAFTPALSAITLLVDDLDRSREFYGRVLATDPAWVNDISLGYNLGSVVLHLLLSSEGEQLLAPTPVGNATTGSRHQLSLWVDDIDMVVSELAGRGVDFDEGPVDKPWGMRAASFHDPDGHSWEIAQDLG